MSERGLRTRHRWWLGVTVALFVALLPFAATSTSADAAEGSDIVVIGGPSVVSDAIVEHLETCTTGSVTRIAGSNRYATAAEVSKRLFSSADVVFLATGLSFPDALAAGPVAAANDAPILLVRTASVPTETLGELDRLTPESIIILGGTGAISGEVEAFLRSRYQSAEVTRIAGADRYATASMISRHHFAPGVPTAYVAVGTNFPDALAGGAAAAVRGAPVLLTATNALPAATIRELARLEPSRIVVLGGTAVISPGVEIELSDYTDGSVRRLAGPSRFSTASAIAVDAFPASAGPVMIATGLNFPDALAAAPGSTGPLLLASEHALHGSTALAIGHFTGVACEAFEEDLGPILAIGDSVMAGASKQYAPVPNLESEIPDLTVDAAVNRQFSHAKSILATALAGSRPPKVVVIHLGTNGPPTSSQIADLMAVAKNVPRVLFLTVKLDKSWETATNAVIRANVPLYANAELVDWWALADPHPEWFSSDVNCGCHLWKSTARQAYIDLIATAIGS